MATVQEILDFEIGKPSWSWRASRFSSLPPEVTFIRPDKDTQASGPDPTARTFNRESGLYEARGADTPRIWGKNQGLMMEGQTTNFAEYSANPTQWTQKNISDGGSRTSILKNESARSFSSSNSSGYVQTPAGTFSGGEEMMYAIVEQEAGANENFKLIARDSTDPAFRAVAQANFQDGLVSEGTDSGATLIGGIFETFDNRGPNGASTVGMLMIAYRGVTQGNNRLVRFQPNRSGGSNPLTVHYLHATDRPNSISPIVTGSSALTKGKDRFQIDGSSFYSDREGTWIVKAKRLFPFLTKHNGNYDNTILRLQSGDVFDSMLYYRGADASGDDSTGDKRTGPLPMKAFDQNRVDTPATVAFNESFVAAASFDDDQGVLAVNGEGGDTAQSSSEIIPDPNWVIDVSAATLIYEVSYYPTKIDLTGAEIIS